GLRMARRPIALDESEIIHSPLRLPRGVAGWLARRLRRLHRRLESSHVSVLWSNLALLLRPIEFGSYALTFVTLCLDAPHLARRLAFIERNDSRLFVRPLKFFLVSVPVVWLGIGFI